MISIALATFNGEKYLQEQLDSLSKQSCLPLELVVCDDGSIDNTIKILKKFKQISPFPVHLYINEKNLGYVDNFFKAARLCKGSWIAFCDQDDVWKPEKLEKVQLVISKHYKDNVLLVSHSAEKTDDKLRLLGQKSPNFKKSRMLNKNHHYGFWVLPGFSCIINKKLIYEFDYSKRPRDFNSGKKQAHDVWICMLTNALGKIYTIKESLVYWRRHNWAETLSVSDIAKPSIKSKILNSQNYGSDLYRFRAAIANESVDTMRQLAILKTNEKKTYDDLMCGADLFDKLSKCLINRSLLYSSQGTLTRLKYFMRMFTYGSYFGNNFYSIGWKSVLKDIHFMIFK